MSPRPEPSRPPHRDPRCLVLVFAGGAVGSLLRAGLAAAVPPSPGAWPWATFVANVSGAFLLGLLLEVLALVGPDVGGARDLRLFAATGLLGGYTTYSTLAVEITRSTPSLALTYGLASVTVGVVATLAGVGLARRLLRGVTR